MSDASAAFIASESKRLASVRARRNWLNPLEALERGFALFQATFSHEAWRYFAGAAPLVVCAIPIWVMNGQIRVSDGELLLEAALLGAAYLLRVWMVGDYVQRVRERAYGVPRPKISGSGAKAAAIGRLLAWKITLSAAALATLPTIAGASWFYSACQFASLEAREDATERHSFGGCLSLASQWFAGGLLLFLMLMPLWIAVWLNGLILAIFIPQLLHSVFGVNTLLSTETGMDALSRSSAFWLSLFAGACLAFDPIVKCTFIVVYQHLRSRREGDDLRGLLAGLPREQQKKAEMVASASGIPARSAKVALLLLLAAVSLGGFRSASARALQAVPSGARAAVTADTADQTRIHKLSQALDEESGRAIYQWHDADHPNPPTWFDKLLVKIGHAIDRAWHAFTNFLSRLWPKGLNISLGNGKEGAWHLKDLRLWVGVIVALTLLAGAFFFWRRRRHDEARLAIPLVATPLPDLSDAAVASDRSDDEWFTLASRLEAEGELRLALRAAYLGLLAGLAQRQWLTIRRDRTNREYLDEFTRRWRRRPQAAVEVRAEVPEKLRGSFRLFDRVWYGSYALTPPAVAAYRRDLRELLNHV